MRSRDADRVPPPSPRFLIDWATRSFSDARTALRLLERKATAAQTGPHGDLADMDGTRIFRTMDTPHPAPGTDTPADVTTLHARLIAARSPDERAGRMRDLTLTANLAALAGLRLRHGHASPQELLLRLAVLRLGPAVVERVYGWRAPPRGP